jgi:hypothetical protein
MKVPRVFPIPSRVFISQNSYGRKCILIQTGVSMNSSFSRVNIFVEYLIWRPAKLKMYGPSSKTRSLPWVLEKIVVKKPFELSFISSCPFTFQRYFNPTFRSFSNGKFPMKF